MSNDFHHLWSEGEPAAPNPFRERAILPIPSLVGFALCVVIVLVTLTVCLLALTSGRSDRGLIIGGFYAALGLFTLVLSLPKILGVDVVSRIERESVHNAEMARLDALNDDINKLHAEINRDLGGAS